MKKLITICLVLLLCASAYGTIRSEARNDRGEFTGPRTSNSQDGNIKSAVAFVNAGLGTLTTGKIWHVDSGASGNGTGTSLTNACLTLEAADVLSAADGGANRGDYIVIAPGHNEALTAGAVNLSTAGMTVKGYGNGTLKPTFDYDVATGTFVISAANIKIENLRFRCSVTGVVSGIDIQTGGDNAQIISCEFGYGETQGTDEFLCAINVHQGAADVLIWDCWFNSDEAGAAEAIRIGCVSGIRIENSTIFGDYSVGGIVQTVSTASGTAGEVFIRNNTISIGEMKSDGGLDIAQPAIEMIEGSAGWIADNRIASDVATGLLMIVADDMIRMNNIITDDDGDEFSGSPEWYTARKMVGNAGTTVYGGSVSGHIDG